MQMWKKQQEGTPFEIKGNFNPSRDDLALLARNVEPENFDSTARKESEEDVERSTYFDAKDILSPPLAASKKKKPTKCHLSKKEDLRCIANNSSDDSEASGFNMSSVSSGSIDTTCSPDKLKKKAEK